jgi:hypothetical protein
MHEDSSGNQSNVVSSASFTTDPNAVPNTPTINAGTPASTTVALTSSAFSDPDVGDTHSASQWQVTTSADTGYASPVINTGDDTTNKTSYTATGLTGSTAYRARVRYKDSFGNYSSYSTSTTFTTASPGDTTAPTVVGNPTTNTTGDTLTVVFSEDVVGVVATQYLLKPGFTLASPVGNGSGGLHGTSWSMTISPNVQNGDVLALDYPTGTSTKDDSNNLLANFTDRAVVNNVPLQIPTINLDVVEATVDATIVGWFAVPGAAGYKVERSLDGTSWDAPVTLGAVLSYSDTTTTLNTTYYYRVAAFNTGG